METLVVWTSRLGCFFLKIRLGIIYCNANKATKVETTSVKRSLAFLQFSTGGNARPTRFVLSSYFLYNEMSLFSSFYAKLLRNNLRICRASPSLSYPCLLLSLIITAIGIVVIVINYPFPSRFLSDNPIKRIGIRAFSIPSNELMM